MRYKLWINGDWEETGDTKVISSPYTQTTVALCEQANEKLIDKAILSAYETFPFFKKSSRYARSLLLKYIAAGIESRKKEFIETIVNEAGKPIQFAEGEVNRGITSFQIASEEAKRYNGEMISLDGDKSGVGFDPAFSYFVPKGVVLAITPFNFPLNLVAHKVAPALAIGATVILKPSPEAPGAANLLTEVFLESVKLVSNEFEKIPSTALQLVHCSNDLASKMVKDKRVAVVSFTGSDKVGWELQKLAAGKKISLELGGNAAVIVHKDADIDLAVRRCVLGAFSYAGQICISVQRIFIHHDIY
ncbi:MAG TPA: aldehyde dehydrogenase family protein, partial [Leptospiraceae bacterium]|nr:aldehyde dehydrogenase family protein [Leptospiraceae bacterium]